MPNQTPLSLLFVGDVQAVEFEPCADQLRKFGLIFSDSVSAAINRIHAGHVPAVVLIAERWPGEVTTRQIAQIQHASPLSRVVRLLGPWLEGELRTGKPPAGTLRAYWHLALPRITVSLQKLACGESSFLCAPITSDEAERHWQRTSAPHRPDRAEFKVAVFAPNRERAEAIVDDCRVQGWAATWIEFDSLEDAANADLAVFDSQRLAASDFERIAQIRNRMKQTPIAVLAGFPRVEDTTRLQALGACTVIAKPYSVEHLAQIPTPC